MSFRAGLVIVILFLLLSPVPAWAIDVVSIQINAGVELIDGTPTFDPFYLDVTVEGRGIAEVTITTPNGCSGPLAQVADDILWAEDVEYESLTEMALDPCLGFGEFIFDLVGSQGEQDSVTLFFDPGADPLFTDYGEVIDPFHLDVDVSLEPTFEWVCVGSCNDKDGWDLQVVHASDGHWAHSEFLSPGSRLWVPGPVAPNTTYRFWNHLEGLIGGVLVPSTTQAEDAFVYGPTWEILNRISFDTLESPVLRVERDQVLWTPLSDAMSYDLVRGDLQTLRGSGGDFSVATEECLAENHLPTFVDYTAEPILAGQGFWFLVRGVDGSGGLTYESLYSTQIGTRDDEIATAVAACF